MPSSLWRTRMPPPFLRPYGNRSTVAVPLCPTPSNSRDFELLVVVTRTVIESCRRSHSLACTPPVGGPKIAFRRANGPVACSHRSHDPNRRSIGERIGRIILVKRRDWPDGSLLSQSLHSSTKIAQPSPSSHNTTTNNNHHEQLPNLPVPSSLGSNEPTHQQPRIIPAR